ncbi:MAG: hypothetical protein WBM32_07830 [Crocosphaera sp.]
MRLNHTSRLILGISALLISIPSFIFFTYWAFQDYLLLDAATNEIMVSKDKISPDEMNYLLSRELAHRLNVLADGTWTLMTAIIILQAISILPKNNE